MSMAIAACKAWLCPRAGEYANCHYLVVRPPLGFPAINRLSCPATRLAVRSNETAFLGLYLSLT